MPDAGSAPTPTPAAGATVPQAGFAEDFVDIFYAPSAVFARRRAASPWPVVLVVTGLTAVVAYIFFSLLGPALDRDLARAVAGTPPEERETGMRVARIMTQYGSLVLVPASVLVLGLVLWLVGKLFDAQQTLRAAFLVVAFSWMPRVVESLLGALQAFVVDVSVIPSMAAVSLTPARFVDAAGDPVLVQVLTRFGPFVIWSYVIVAIGLKVTGRIPGAKAAIAAAIVWVVAFVPTLFSAVGARAAGGPG